MNSGIRNLLLYCYNQGLEKKKSYCFIFCILYCNNLLIKKLYCNDLLVKIFYFNNNLLVKKVILQYFHYYFPFPDYNPDSGL